MIESTNYMTAAYIVATTIYIIYSITLWSRARRYRRQLNQDEAQ
jgi:hypothetical protein